MNAKADRYRQMFLDECEEHIRQLEGTLAAMRDGATAQNLIDDSFRAAHSIKGGAGMVGFTRIVPFAHTLETVLDAVRLREIVMTAGLAACMLRAVDCLSDLILAAGRGIDLPPGFEAPHSFALAETSGINFGGNKKLPQESLASSAALAEQVTWHIRFKPNPGILRRANDPILIFRNLKQLGTFTITAELSALPKFIDLPPTDACLAWQIQLATNAGEKAIRDVFEFVSDDCDLAITRNDQLSENIFPAATAEAQIPAAAGQPKSIRVELDRIDRLVNLAGEIAISQALVAQLIDQNLFNEKPQLVQELSQLLTHTQNLQDSVMAIRAQPIRAIFERMPRLVRELAESTGKHIILRMSGEATEIDKTVIEQLSDPIVHMLRNSADHGLETPEQRLAAGKPADGIIKLHAEQRGSRIVIEVSDDGKGINREEVRRRAISRNLIAADADLSNDEIDALIFLPGFTTAANVTSISGRGVGMDVVKRNIQKLGGRISIRSEPGKGSTFTLTLPLTLAVLEGMIVRSGSDHYVIPVANVVECRASWSKETRHVPGSGQVMYLRGKYIAVVQLHAVFTTRENASGESSVAIITEIEGGELVAIVVDEIVGQQQVVIKSVSDNMVQAPGIAGATILGNGKVALILDSSEIAAMGAHSGGTPENLTAIDRRKVA